MKRLIPFLLLGVLLPGCASTPATPPVPARNGPLSEDEQRLQGRWVVVHNEMRKITLPEFNGRVHVYNGRRFHLDTDKGSEVFRVDEHSNPKRVDFDNRLSPLIQGIYELNGDQLKVCIGAPGAPRPTEFATSPFNQNVLTILVRQKPGKGRRHPKTNPHRS